jgi:hypothetical protein
VQGALGVSERRVRRVRDDEATPVEAIVALAAESGRYGDLRIPAMLRTQGWRVNAKRAQRIGRRAGLNVPKSSRSAAVPG